jgi:hypothetical protein
MLNTWVRLWLPALLINVITFAVVLSYKTKIQKSHFLRIVYTENVNSFIANLIPFY